MTPDPCGCEESVTLRAERDALRREAHGLHVSVEEWHDCCRRAQAERDALRVERDALRDRITTICDEALGLQPVQSDDESLSLIEQQLHALRVELDEAQAALRAVRHMLTGYDYVSVGARDAAVALIDEVT